MNTRLAAQMPFSGSLYVSLYLLVMLNKWASFLKFQDGYGTSGSSFLLNLCDARLSVIWSLTCDAWKPCHSPGHGRTVSSQVLAGKCVAGTPPWWSLSSGRWARVWWPEGSSFLCDQRKHLVPSKPPVLVYVSRLSSNQSQSSETCFLVGCEPRSWTSETAKG